MFFVQACEKLTHALFTFMENWLKLCIYCNFLKKFLKISKILRGPGGSAPPPRTPTRPTPQNVTPEPKSWRCRCRWSTTQVFYKFSDRSGDVPAFSDPSLCTVILDLPIGIWKYTCLPYDKLIGKISSKF